VAKKKRKPRTPPPPRRQDASKAPSGRAVQAPQVRKKQRDPAAREKTKRYGLYALAGVIVIGIAAALIAVFATGGSGGTSRSELNVNFAELPGISHGPAPWQAEINNLGLRLPKLGLKPLTTEGTIVHIHQHLDIFINGKHVNVPPYVGINTAEQYLTELHTHKGEPNIIHVESDTQRQYSLGEFFGVWGVFLSRRCIGGYCAKPGTPLKFYVDGKQYRRDPVTLVLKSHEEIAIVYGKPPKKIPSTYNFSAQGL
jgi:hypothetical protein